MKIVLNKCCGGFSISLEADKFMAARGNETALCELEDYYLVDKTSVDIYKYRGIVNRNEKEKFCDGWYGYGYINSSDGYERTDPDLVAAVETLGSKVASGSMASLEVVDIMDGIDWYIDDYDGIETVHENHRMW